MGGNRAWDRTDDGFCRKGFKKNRDETDRLKGGFKQDRPKSRHEIEEELEDFGLTASQLRVVIDE